MKLSDVVPGLAVTVHVDGHEYLGVVKDVRPPNGGKGNIRVRVGRARFAWVHADQLDPR